MASAYPIILRMKVMRALESGIEITKIRQMFDIGRSTIYKWKALKNRTGTVGATIGYQKGHSHKVKNMQLFKDFLDARKDKTAKELAKEWGNISPTTILRLIKKLKYSYKKNFSSSQEK